MNIERYKSSFPAQTQFITNADSTGDHIFTQVKREGKVAIYRRNRVKDGALFGFEVVILKHIKAGAPLPGGNVVENDYESYPGVNAFGKTAWFCKDETAALDRFEEVNDEPAMASDDNETETLPIVEVIVNKTFTPNFNIPTGTFTQAQFATVNNMPPRGSVYNVIQSLIRNGTIREDSRVKMGGGRPTTLFIGC